MYRVVASHTRDRGEVVLMDMYEVLSLLFLGGSFLIALLAYIDVKPQIISGDFRRLFQMETPVTVCG